MGIKIIFKFYRVRPKIKQKLNYVCITESIFSWSFCEFVLDIFRSTSIRFYEGIFMKLLKWKIRIFSVGPVTLISKININSLH